VLLLFHKTSLSILCASNEIYLLVLLHPSLVLYLILFFPLDISPRFGPCSKFTHLEPDAKRGLVDALADAVGVHCQVLRDQARRKKETVPQRVRDSFACHLYFLYMTVVLMESSTSASASSGGNADDNNLEKELALGQHKLRSRAMDSMAEACQAMIRFRNVLWQRGVMDEALVLLPAKVSYRMLEKCRIVTARKMYCGDQALQILATILDACGADSLDRSGSSSAESSIFTTISATLMDLMHGFEHMAPMCCELCTSTLAQIRPQHGPNDTYVSNDVLAIELLREVVRVASKARSQGGAEGSTAAAAASTAKASGIAWVAPFIPLLTEARPHLALQQMPHLIVPLLQSSQSYTVRSAVVQAVKHVLDHLGKQQQQHRLDEAGGEVDAEGDLNGLEESRNRSRASGGLADVTKSRDSLLSLLMERAYDVSSYTRAAALRALSQLVTGGTLPLKTHLLSATQLAMDRLHDKTVVVRKQAMQVRMNFGLAKARNQIRWESVVFLTPFLISPL
jgi:condensin complex subunit 1